MPMRPDEPKSDVPGKPLGRWQRAILAAIESYPWLVMLRGDSRAENVAILRAARGLARSGKIVFVRRFDDSNRAECYAAKPGTLLPHDGQPVNRVAGVPAGTPATLDFSIRGLADDLGVSPTQIRRDLAKAAGHAIPRGMSRAAIVAEVLAWPQEKQVAFMADLAAMGLHTPAG